MLKDVEKSNPGILSDGDRVCNMDETSISCELGKRTKGFGSPQTHHGGFVSSSLDSIGLALKTLKKCFQVIGLFPVNWDFSKRFKNIYDCINSKFSSEQFRSSATSTFSAIGSVHMRQTDRRTAETVLNIARTSRSPHECCNELPSAFRNKNS